MSNKHCKVVIFDMDETLGYFTQLDIFINSLKSYYKKNIEDRLKELREKQKRRELSIRNISLLRLLDIYIKKHGLIVNIYKKSEKNNYMNVKISQI